MSQINSVLYEKGKINETEKATGVSVHWFESGAKKDGRITEK